MHIMHHHLIGEYWLQVLLCSYHIAGETVTVVGDHNPALLKYFDCTRSEPRSAFESNVVYQFEIMEYVRLLFVGIQLLSKWVLLSL